jgi:hypothetical protein
MFVKHKQFKNKYLNTEQSNYAQEFEPSTHIWGTCKLNALANAENYKKLHPLPVYKNHNGRQRNMPIHNVDECNTQAKYHSLRQLAKQKIGSLQGEVLSYKDLVKLFKLRGFICKTIQAKAENNYRTSIQKALQKNKIIVAFYLYRDIDDPQDNLSPRAKEEQEHAVLITAYNAENDSVRLTGVGAEHHKWISVKTLFESSNKLTAYRQQEFYDYQPHAENKYRMLNAKEIDNFEQDKNIPISAETLETSKIPIWETKTPKQKTFTGKDTGFKAKLLICDTQSKSKQFIIHQVKQDFKHSKIRTQDKAGRFKRKTRDKFKIIFTRQSNKKLAELIDEKANNIHKIFTQQDNYINDDYDGNIAYIEKDICRISKAVEAPTVMQALNNLILSKNNTFYKHKYDKHGMMLLRKMAKIMINYEITHEQQYLGKFNSKQILKLINCIDEEAMYPIYRARLDSIKKTADAEHQGKRGKYNFLMLHEDVDDDVNFLQTLPLKNNENTKKQAQALHALQNHFKLSRLNKTKRVNKFAEIASYGNKSQRHAAQLKDMQTQITNVIENLDQAQNFTKFLHLCNSPAFKQAMLTSPDLAVAVYTLLDEQAAKTQFKKQIDAFYDANKDLIDAHIAGNLDTQSRDNITQGQIESYVYLIASKYQNSNQEQYQKNLNQWFLAGHQAYKKNMRMRIAKRALAQGITPAALLALFSFSTARITVINAIKIVPAFIIALRVLFTLTLQSNSVLQKKITQYEKEVKHGTEATRMEKIQIIATSLAQPVMQGAVFGFTLFSARALAVLALGNKGGAVLFAGLSAALPLTITPMAYYTGNKEFKQSMLDNLSLE